MTARKTKTVTVAHPPARPFTETDWYGFAGATSWGHGTGPEVPMMREVGDWLLVADAVGVEAENGEEEPSTYRWDVEFPCQAAAAAFLNGLPADFSPETYGFERV